MKQDFNLPNLVEHPRNQPGKWFYRQTKREITFPVSISDAQYRLQIAFANTITISRGFLAGKYKYKGQVYNNELDVKFNGRRKSRMHYSMHGQLLPDPKGSRLVMMVEDKTPVLFLLADLAITAAVLLVIGPADDVAIFLAIFSPVLLFVAMAWQRMLAAKNISDLISEIVSRQV